MRGGGHNPERGGGEIARHVEVARVQLRAAAHADGLAVRSRSMMTGGAWKWASRRSVWSRDVVFSVMLVVPCAKRPASSRHDFNCALATGSVYSMPVSGAALDLQWRGVLVAPALEIFAPIWRSGSTMRFIGRLESEASPTSRLLNGWPRARRPSGAWPCRSFRNPAARAAAAQVFRSCRCTRSSGFGISSMVQPIACSARMVQTQSSPGRKPVDRSSCRRPARRRARRGERGSCRPAR